MTLQNEDITVGLDLGHGEDTFERTGGKGIKKDGKVYEEHHFNSKVGIKVKELLNHNGIKVIFGQEPFKKEVPLRDRTNLYNKEKVDIVWSIHANAASSKSATGRCSYHWHTSKGGRKLSGCFVDGMKTMGLSLHGDGIHESKPGTWSNFHIVRETNMVALLTENGFMTTPSEFEDIFKSDEYVDKVAEAHSRAICKYFDVSFTKPIKVEAPVIYRVRKNWDDSDSQLGAYSILENAEAIAKKNSGYKVFDETGQVVYDPEEEFTKDTMILDIKQELADAQQDINRLSKLNRELMEERNMYKTALMDIGNRIDEMI